MTAVTRLFYRIHSIKGLPHFLRKSDQGLSVNVSNAAASLYQAAAVQGIAPGYRASPFVVVAGPRSGSTLLQTLLHSHTRAVCMHELLQKSGGTSRFYRYNLGRRKKLIHLREENMRAFLHDVLVEPTHPPWIEAVGFKAMYMHPREDSEHPAAWESLGEVPGLRVIWLYRNPVRRVVSFAVARETGKWVDEETEKEIRLDPDYILQRLEVEKRKAKVAHEALRKCKDMDVQFESLTSRPEEVLSDVQDFLGLPHRSLHSPLSQQNSRTLEEMVSNFEELKSALSGTEWEKALSKAEGRRPEEL